MMTTTMIAKTNIKKISLSAVGIATGLLLLAPIANAAPEISITQSNMGSTTVVEQYSDGNVATITSTPNGISMQNGMPYAVTQVTNVPRYAISQGSSTVVTTGPITSQVTQQIGNTIVTTPINSTTQILSPVTTIPIINNQVIVSPVINSPVMNSQVITTTSLESLQLTPTFSTPNVASANTKIMKIMKSSNGREVAVPANHIAPGDIIEYHTTYMNNSAQPVNDLNAMVSLPSGVRLVSLNSSLPTLATTGGDSYQTIQQVGNSVVVQENYSGLKWNLVNLASNTPQTVVIRAKVQ